MAAGMGEISGADVFLFRRFFNSCLPIWLQWYSGGHIYLQ